MRKIREKNPKSLGIGSLFAWQSRAVSHGICMMILGYLSIYCTDTLKMDPYLVGMLLVFSKLLDVLFPSLRLPGWHLLDSFP